MELPEGTEYLGDGAYVFIDDWGSIQIITSNGLSITNRVVLEREHFEALIHYVKINGHKLR
jgi:hypothetical protein